MPSRDAIEKWAWRSNLFFFGCYLASWWLDNVLVSMGVLVVFVISALITLAHIGPPHKRAGASSFSSDIARSSSNSECSSASRDTKKHKEFGRPKTITIPWQDFLDHHGSLWAVCPACNKRGVILFSCDVGSHDIDIKFPPRCSKCDTMFAFSWKLTEITTP